MAEVSIEIVDPDSNVALQLVGDYTQHLTVTVPNGYNCATDSPPPAGSFRAPHGRFLVMFENPAGPDAADGGDREAIGCGAVWRMEPGVAEIRRMWVVPSRHGRGHGRRMLDALESEARELGCDMARLDSMRALTAAVAMYRSQGYIEIDDYNGNPNATIWMQRSLADP
ncbi:MAG: GNAT family N-acetyltransferase [Phycisphaerales bacterium JB041]